MNEEKFNKNAFAGTVHISILTIFEIMNNFFIHFWFVEELHGCEWWINLKELTTVKCILLSPTLLRNKPTENYEWKKEEEKKQNSTDFLTKKLSKYSEPENKEKFKLVFFRPSLNLSRKISKTFQINISEIAFTNLQIGKEREKESIDIECFSFILYFIFLSNHPLTPRNIFIFIIFHSFGCGCCYRALLCTL